MSSLQCPKLEHTNNTSFAFLVHSQDTIPHNLPPSVDNKPLARQRRRRTSPEDQAILEEEYQRDPRPDKTARKRIVDRVALGEKEVQIWFQNRRQTSRRKSRPLWPLEILPGTDVSLHPVVDHTAESEDEELDSTQLTAAHSGSDSVVTRTNPRPVRANEFLQHNVDNAEHACLKFNATETSSQHSQDPTTSENSIQASFCESLPSDSRNTYDHTEDVAQHEGKQSSEVLTWPTSRIRLSTSSDGNARVITGNDASPSPPRRGHQTTDGLSGSPNLRRSYSAAGLNESVYVSWPKNSAQRTRRAPSGRSRDSRAWEFWCDNESRNQLVKTADQEQNGSAADAISLMRSNSKGQLSSQTMGNKWIGSQQLVKTKASLGRALSSTGRLQSERKDILIFHEDEDRNGNPSGLKLNAKPTFSPTGDSDKENLEPGAQIVKRPRKAKHLHLHPSRPPVLGESQTVPSQSSNVNRVLGRNHYMAKSGKLSGVQPVDKENHNPEDDAEISSFMKGGRPASFGSSIAAVDDMDCVQGLLSLSQGNWC